MSNTNTNVKEHDTIEQDFSMHLKEIENLKEKTNSIKKESYKMYDRIERSLFEKLDETNKLLNTLNLINDESKLDLNNELYAKLQELVKKACYRFTDKVDEHVFFEDETIID